MTEPCDCGHPIEKHVPWESMGRYACRTLGCTCMKPRAMTALERIDPATLPIPDGLRPGIFEEPVMRRAYPAWRRTQRAVEARIRWTDLVYAASKRKG